jgi:hypothetical protein
MAILEYRDMFIKTTLHANVYTMLQKQNSRFYGGCFMPNAETRRFDMLKYEVIFRITLPYWNQSSKQSHAFIDGWS